MVLGFDPADDKKIALDMLRENGVTFPNIIDSSDAADKVCFEQRLSAWRAVAHELHHRPRRQGRGCLVGYDEGEPRAIAALQKTGGQLAEAIRRDMDDQGREGRPRGRCRRTTAIPGPSAAPITTTTASAPGTASTHPAKDINYNPVPQRPRLGALGVQEVQGKSHQRRSAGQRLRESRRCTDRPFRVASEGWRDSRRRLAIPLYGLGPRWEAMGWPGWTRLASAPIS